MELSTAIEHIKFHHGNAEGWITLAKKENGQYRQHHYRYEELQEELQQWIGENIYFSQNTFYKPQRRIENIRQLRSLYVDVDHHLFNYSPEWVIGKMELELFGQYVPEPNFIIHSGRGFYVVWLLEPVPYKALPLWQAVENYLSDKFASLGGDAKVTDAARVLRLPGSINSKSGEEVTVQYRHDYRYTLRQIQEEYLPQLPQVQPNKKGRPSKTKHLFNTYSLYYARLQDLIKLLQLRSHDVKGYRETICFLYRYWNCCFLQDEKEALEHTLELNAEFKHPLPDREVIRATRSAEKAWFAKSNAEADRIAKEKGYPGAGYNVTNEKLISWLDITEIEQKQLSTIIGRKEKQIRDTEATREQRRAAGMVSRDVYLAKAAERRSEARIMRQNGLSYRKIGEALGCSEGEIRRLLKNA